MKNRRIHATILGLVTVAAVLSGCSAGSVPVPPQSSVPEATTPPAVLERQEITPPAGAVEQQTLPTVPAVEDDGPSVPSDDAQENSATPASYSEPVTGPSEELYALRTDDGVDVVYFMTSNPCSCMIEFSDAIEQSILTNFQNELQSGELRYFVMVSNAPDNMDYVEAFNAQPFDLFIVDYVDGQGTAEPSAEVWTYQGDDEAVMEYVRTQVAEKLDSHR